VRDTDSHDYRLKIIRH